MKNHKSFVLVDFSVIIIHVFDAMSVSNLTNLQKHNEKVFDKKLSSCQASETPLFKAVDF